MNLNKESTALSIIVLLSVFLHIEWNRYDNYDLKSMYPWKSQAINSDSTKVSMEFPFKDGLRIEYSHYSIWKKNISNWNLPLWNNYMFLGIPLISSGNFAPFAIQNIPLVFLPLEIGLEVIDWAQTLISAILLFLFFRTINLSIVASLFGCIAYMGNTGFLLADQIIIQKGAMIWIPGVFFAFEWFILKKGLLHLLLFIFFIALQFLNVNLEIVVYTYVFLIPYIFFRVWTIELIKKKRIKILCLCFLGLFLGILLTSFQWLPILTLAKDSSREIIEAGDKVTALHFFRFFTVIIPNFFGDNTFSGYYEKGWGQNLYLGSSVLFLNLLSINYKKIIIIFFYFSLSLSILWITSNYIYSYIFSSIPIFNQINTPIRMNALFFFFTSIICAFGIEAFYKSQDKKGCKSFNFSRSLFLFIIIIIISAHFIFSYIHLNINDIKNMGLVSNNLFDKIIIFLNQINYNSKVLIFPFMISTILVLIMFNRRLPTPKFIIILLSLMVAEKLYFKKISTFPNSNNKSIVNTLGVEFLKNDKSFFRTAAITSIDTTFSKGYFSDIFEPNLLSANLIHDIRGFTSMIPKNTHQYLGEIRENKKENSWHRLLIRKNQYSRKMLNIANVKYFVTSPLESDSIPNTQNVYYGKDFNIYENLMVVPRVYTSTNFNIIPDMNETIEFIKSEKFDPNKQIIVDKNPGNYFINNKVKNNFSNAKITRYDANSIKIKTSVTDPAVVVLLDSYDNGWKAYVDGKKVNILKVNGVFRGIPVTANTNFIEMKYFPISLLLGLIITLCGVFIITIIIIFESKIFNMHTDGRIIFSQKTERIL
jgi:hypothetical protein